MRFYHGTPRLGGVLLPSRNSGGAYFLINPAAKAEKL
jgi:hypothetical protein